MPTWVKRCVTTELRSWLGWKRLTPSNSTLLAWFVGCVAASKRTAHAEMGETVRYDGAWELA